MDLDLSCVESFVVLAAEQHFGRAAAHLHLSQSALSKRIMRLEKDVGTGLVDRDAGGYRGLTGAGERFLEHCESLLHSAREARRYALHGQQIPTVRLGMPGSPADHIGSAEWQAMVAAISQTLPGCRVLPRNVPYGRVEESLLSDRVDILLSTGEFDHPSLFIMTLMLAGRALLVPTRHELAAKRAIFAEDMADLLIIREPTATPRWMAPWLLADLRDPTDTPVVDVRARTMVDVQQAVMNGRATAVVSATLAPLLRPGLLALPILDVRPTPMFAIRRRDDERDEVLAVMQVLGALFAAYAAAHSGSVMNGAHHGEPPIDPQRWQQFPGWPCVQRPDHGPASMVTTAEPMRIRGGRYGLHG